MLSAFKRKSSSSSSLENKRNTKTKTVCSCCNAEGKQVSGCSCRGGTSHQCSRCLDLPLSLTTVSSENLKEALSSYFDELKLADVAFDYLGKTFITTWRVSDDLSITLPLQS